MPEQYTPAAIFAGLAVLCAVIACFDSYNTSLGGTWPHDRERIKAWGGLASISAGLSIIFAIAGGFSE